MSSFENSRRTECFLKEMEEVMLKGGITMERVEL
jgi:hypothetical protein